MKWTEQELNRIREHYSSNDANPSALAKELGRTIASIKCKACNIGVVSHRKLDQIDEDYIRNLKEIKNINDIAKGMGRCWNTVKKIIVKLGLEGQYFPFNSFWTPNEEEIKLMNSNLTLKQISQKIGRAEATILKKIRQMELPRPHRIKKEPRIPKVKIDKPVVVNRDSGIDRIRQAMERISR